MNEITKMNDEGQVSNTKSELEIMTEELLLDTVSSLDANKTIKVPISELAALGAGVSSLTSGIATVTQTISIPANGLYRIPNKKAKDALKKAKDGNFWGSDQKSRRFI